MALLDLLPNQPHHPALPSKQGLQCPTGAALPSPSALSMALLPYHGGCAFQGLSCTSRSKQWQRGNPKYGDVGSEAVLFRTHQALGLALVCPSKTSVNSRQAWEGADEADIEQVGVLGPHACQQPSAGHLHGMGTRSQAAAAGKGQAGVAPQEWFLSAVLHRRPKACTGRCSKAGTDRLEGLREEQSK